MPVFFDIASRTEGDYGLTTTAGPIYHVLPLSEIEVHLWGVPADPSHDFLRAQTPIGPFPILGSPSNAPLRPYLQNPTTCGVPLDSERRGWTTTQATSFTAETPYPAMTGCDQLGFNPSLSAQPTTTAADTAVGLDVNCRCRRRRARPRRRRLRSSRTRSTCRRGSRSTRTPPTARSPARTSQARSADPRTRGQCPEFSKIGTVEDRQLGAARRRSTGRSTSASRCPGTAYRIVLTADGLRDPHEARRHDRKPTRRPGSSRSASPNLPQSPLTEFDMHIFGSERGSLATPSQCGTYPVESDLRALELGGSEPGPRTASSRSTSGPNGSPARARRATSRRASKPAASNTTAGMYTPFNLASIAMTATRTAQPGRGHDATRLRRLPARRPVLPAVGDRPARLDPLYSGVAEQATPACPAASQDRHGHRRRRRRLPAAARRRQGLPRRPIQRRAAEPRGRRPGRVRPLRPRQWSPSGPRSSSTRSPARSASTPTRCRRSSRGSRCARRLLDVNLDRPDFTFNPTNCDPFAVTSSIFGDEGGAARRGERFQVANCASLPYGPNAGDLPAGQSQTARPPGDPRRASTRAPGKRTSKSISVLLPKGSLLDNTPHRHDLHPGRVRRRTPARPARSRESRRRRRRSSTSRLSGPVYLRSSSNKLPDLVIDLNGQVDIEVAGQGRQRQRPDAGHLRLRARPADLELRARHAGRPEGPAGKQRKRLQAPETRHAADGGAERGTRDQAAEAADELRLQRAPQASRVSREGGAIGDGDYEERARDHA